MRFMAPRRTPERRSRIDGNGREIEDPVHRAIERDPSEAELSEAGACPTPEQAAERAAATRHLQGDAGKPRKTPFRSRSSERANVSRSRTVTLLISKAGSKAGNRASTVIIGKGTVGCISSNAPRLSSAHTETAPRVSPTTQRSIAGLLPLE